LEMGVSRTICLSWPQTPPNLSFPIRITGVSHGCPAKLLFTCNNTQDSLKCYSSSKKPDTVDGLLYDSIHVKKKRKTFFFFIELRAFHLLVKHSTT
jgi:hypothetical protein